MHFFKSAAFAVAALLVGQSVAAPIRVHPGTAKDIIITADNTINGTSVELVNGKPPAVNDIIQSAADGKLPLSLFNNLGDGVNAYITGKDANDLAVILQPDGTFFYPDAAGVQNPPTAITQDVAIPLGPKGSTTQVTIPALLSAARVWFAAGELSFYVQATAAGGNAIVEPSATNPADPSANVNWGFVELTWNSSGLFANISYVDFVGLPLGMTLTTGDNSTQSADGLVGTAVAKICSDLIAQAAADGLPWDRLCEVGTDGTPLRVLSPTDYISTTPDAFSDYWTTYVDDVWTQYTANPLTIDTQADAGKVACQVNGDVLECAGDNRSYAKPGALDIFGCNGGPFLIQEGDNDLHKAIVPRLCAAFNRATLLLDGGDVQPSLPSTSYYTVSPSNHFSRIVHQWEVSGTGYAFSYDDVNPSGENQSGSVSSGDPTLLSVRIGGP
jgi:hypothetical protein